MGAVPLEHVLALSVALFAIGALAALTRRGLVGVLIAVELMLNAGILALVAFSRVHVSMEGQLVAVVVMVAAVAEVAVGVALAVALLRNRDSQDVEELSVLKW